MVELLVEGPTPSSDIGAMISILVPRYLDWCHGFCIGARVSKLLKYDKFDTFEQKNRQLKF